MKLVKLLIASLLVMSIQPIHSMAYLKSWWGSNQTPEQRAQEATLALQKLSTYRPSSIGESWKIPKIKQLIQDGANPNIPNADGDYPLILVAGEHWPELLSLLLEKNVDPNVQNSNGSTALLAALQHTIENAGDYERKKQIVHLLLEKQADPNIRNNGVSPLSAAIWFLDKPELVKLLLDYGANPFNTDQQGLSDRDLGLQSQNPEIRKLLSGYGIQKLP